MESWRRAWRQGFAPGLSERELLVLRQAFESRDKRLIQGATTSPPPMMSTGTWPVQAACAVSYCGWQARGLEKVEEVELYFAEACQEADRRLKEPAACRFYLNWYDETPMPEVRRQMLDELSRELAARAGAAYDEVAP